MHTEGHYKTYMDSAPFRLECLKMAFGAQKNNSFSVSDLIGDAKKLHDWVNNEPQFTTEQISKLMQS